MKLSSLFMVLSLACVGPAIAKPIRYQPPPETAALPPGAEVDLVDANCSACHSVDYITTQPRKLSDPTTFWTNAVKKMRNVYGMKVSEEDAQKIVKYLSEMK